MRRCPREKAFQKETKAAAKVVEMERTGLASMETEARKVPKVEEGESPQRRRRSKGDEPWKRRRK